MPHMTFGDILREARERKGYDVSSAARKLRIRADILRAIENNDFSRMPPRGYARNMVNAYARLVGLNPTEITRMYLDEAYAYQVGRTRDDARPARPASRGGRSSRHGEDENREERRGRETRRGGDRQQGRASRTSARDRLERRGAERPAPQNRRSSRREEARDQHGISPRVETTRRTNHTALPTTQYTNFIASPGSGNAAQSRIPVIAVGVVILVLLIVIASLAFGGRGGSSSVDDKPKVAITGVTDTSGEGSGSGSGESGQAASSSDTAPTSVQVTYEMTSSQQAYVIITADGTSQEQMITGPVKQTVDVTGTWSLATWLSSDFKVTVDGKQVDFQTGSTGMPTATVNFQDYLDAWNQAHPGSSASPGQGGSSGTGSTSSGTSGTTGTTGSASGTTSSSSGASSGTAATTGGSSSGAGTASTGTGTTSSTTGLTSASSRSASSVGSA